MSILIDLLIAVSLSLWIVLLLITIMFAVKRQLVFDRNQARITRMHDNAVEQMNKWVNTFKGK